MKEKLIQIICSRLNEQSARLASEFTSSRAQAGARPEQKFLRALVPQGLGKKDVYRGAKK